MRKKRPGTYAPLATHYYDDPKIIEAGEEAELLYVRMLAYASGQPDAEGLIPDAVVRFRLGLDPNAPVTRGGTGNGTGNGTGTRIERLERSGLIAREGDSWRIVAWLKWNRSRADIEHDKADDKRRKTAVTRGGTGNGTGNGTGSGSSSGATSGSGFRNPDTDTDTDTDIPLTDVRGVQGGEPASQPALALPQVATAANAAEKPKRKPPRKRPRRFDEFWAAYPRTANKTDARRAYTKQLDAGVDEHTLIAAAVAFRQACEHNRTEQRFIPHASTWLNQQRWADPPEILDAPRDRRQQETADWYARSKARIAASGGTNPLLEIAREATS